ncbi:MAG: response regulator [Burkholderiales bacterium]
MVEPSHRIESLIANVALAIIAFFAVVSLVAIGLLVGDGRPAERMSRYAMPITALVTSIPAVLLVRRGHPRVAAGIALGATWVSIVVYVVVSGYGAHSYMFSVVAVIVLIVSLLIGPRAGLVAAAASLVAFAAVIAAEVSGYVVDHEAVRSIPLANIAIVQTVAIAALGAVPYFFSRAFQETLRGADEQERRMRQLIDVAPLGYVIHRDGRVVFANRVAAATTGFATPDAIVGASVYDLMPPAERERAMARMEEARSLAPGAQLPATLYRFSDPEGRERQIEMLTVCIELVDGPALLTVLRDVTRERTAAAALADAKGQAEAASRAKSDFVANMSHEIRTPLNAIVGLTHLLHDPSLPAARRDDYLGKIRNASQSLLEIVSDVLDVSKIEAGALELESIDFDPRREVDSVVQIHATMAADKGITLTARIADDLPAALRGDPVRFRQVLNNYVSNAVKFTATGGVTIRLAVPSPGRVRIEVEDTGMGIDEARRERLFVPFTQADESTTRRFGGTGLGLALVRQLAGQMGGNVGVESRPGAGSVFWAELALPAGDPGAVRPAARAGAVAPSAASGLEGARVLLVEDNEVNRIVAVSVLERLGVDVVAVADGREAVDHFADREAPGCDAVLMDIQMPVMDGYEATRRLRERFPAGTLPIIAMTAAALDDDRRRCLDAGMDDYVQKPFEVARLAATLRRWIGRPRPQSAAVAASRS